MHGWFVWMISKGPVFCKIGLFSRSKKKRIKKERKLSQECFNALVMSQSFCFRTLTLAKHQRWAENRGLTMLVFQVDNYSCEATTLKSGMED